MKSEEQGHWPPAVTASRRILEVLRYLIVSIAALSTDLATFSSCLRLLHFSWPVSAAAGFLVGVLVSYWASVLWVFKSRRCSSSPRHEFAIYLLIGAAGLAVTQAVLWVLIEKLQFQSEASRLCAAAVTFSFNYAARATLLFRTGTVQPQPQPQAA